MRRVKKVQPQSDADDTPARILTAARTEFAENGFRKASVRDICSRASVNVAAISYHFGDKYGLYRQTMRQTSLVQRQMPGADDDAHLSGEEQLARFVQAMLALLVDDSVDAESGKLMARELIEPTEFLDEHVREVIRPAMNRLEAIIDQIVPGVDPYARLLACQSVVGQILLYHNASEVVRRLIPGFEKHPGRHAILASHITAFSLGGIRAVATNGSGKVGRAGVSHTHSGSKKRTGHK